MIFHTKTTVTCEGISMDRTIDIHYHVNPDGRLVISAAQERFNLFDHAPIYTSAEWIWDAISVKAQRNLESLMIAAWNKEHRQGIALDETVSELLGVSHAS